MRGREEHTFCGYGEFWLRNFCFWWKKWCVFGWKVGFAVGLRKERWKRKVYRVFEKLYFDFKLFIYFFFNIVLMWKIVGASKVSVLYIYIYIDDLLLGFIRFLSFAVLSSLCLSQFSKPLNHIPWALSHSLCGKKCQPPITVIYRQSRYQCRFFYFCYLRFRYLDLFWFSLI